VARELGIPAIVNTRRGTDVLRNGDGVRVDGKAGTVEILECAGGGFTAAPAP
jgi:pyruvate,water dikinase